jgi:multicomponent Na+:H+ antiporter subunit B
MNGILIDLVLLTMLAITAIAIVRVHDLFAVAMLMGIFSLICAGFFVTLDAVDVAFTEASVGAGISTLLMLSTLAIVRRREEKPLHQFKPMPLLAVILTGSLLVYATWDLPFYGEHQTPVHQHIGKRYLQESAAATGMPNVVTSVLASYRGYDTMGELTVIFTAGVGVILLLGRSRKQRPESRPKSRS